MQAADLPPWRSETARFGVTRRYASIVDVLRDYGYVESRGMRVVSRRTFPMLHDLNGTVAEFVATEDYQM